MRDRGVKTEDFYVLRNTKMPAVLIEHGFYTNETEVQKLLSPTFREQCAQANARGILSYFSIPWVDKPYITTNHTEAAKEWGKLRGLFTGADWSVPVTREELATILYLYSMKE